MVIYRSLYVATSCTVVPMGVSCSVKSLIQPKICPMSVCYYSDTRRMRRKTVGIKRHHMIRLAYILCRDYVMLLDHYSVTSIQIRDEFRQVFFPEGHHRIGKGANCLF